MRYGAGRWGERYVTAAKITGYDPRSLANLASVALAFQLSRRRDDLTWSHHAAVTGLSVEAQEYWLDQAATKRLSVADLRIEVRSAQKRERDERERTIERRTPDIPAVVCPQCGYELSKAYLGSQWAGRARRPPQQ